MNIVKLITLTGVILFTSVLGLSAQSTKLKKADKEKTEKTNGKSPIKTNKGELTEEDKADIQKAKDNASKAKTSDTFKKKKATIDKAKAKVAQLRAKFRSKLESGDWSQEKFDKMMAKLKVKEEKIAQKKTNLVNSLMDK